MALRENVAGLVELVKSKSNYLSHNEVLFNIYEGDLLTYICADLKKQLSERAYTQMVCRVAPINILIKIIDKLSKIYQQSPVRSVEDGTDQDAELLSWYEKEMEINAKMNIANEFFNLFKNCLIQPYIHNGCPRLRAIPSDRFVVISTDPVDPLNPTGIVLVHSVEKDAFGSPVVIYHAYTDSEFLIFNSKEEILYSKMEALGNAEGVNPIGRLPFIYVNKSSNLLMPVQDSDTLKMTKLIPILISDLNYAVMYQSFSITYGINIDAADMEKNPDAFWFLKQDDPELKPEIGIIKPQVDITEVLGLVQSELALWLNSKGIKPGSIGQLQGDNFSSGVSKMIDEMDTTESKKEQVTYFQAAEKRLWDLLLNYLHPYWVKQGLIENKVIFTPTASVQTDFLEQKTIGTRKDLVDEVKEEFEAGFLTKKDAIKRLNPEMTEEQIEEYIAEIAEEKKANTPEPLQSVALDPKVKDAV